MDQDGRSRQRVVVGKNSKQKTPLSPSTSQAPIPVPNYFNNPDDDSGIDDSLELGDFSAYADALTAAQAVQQQQQQQQEQDMMEISVEDSKRGRGRPKGSKNKPGHKAGRPRKSMPGDDGSPAPKRARPSTGTSLSNSLSSFASMGLPDVQYQQLHRQLSQHHHHPHSHSHDPDHDGDIPVDPSLMSHSSDDRDNAVTGSSLERFSVDFLNTTAAAVVGSGEPVASTSTSEAESAAMAYFSRQGISPAPAVVREDEATTVEAINSAIANAASSVSYSASPSLPPQTHPHQTQNQNQNEQNGVGPTLIQTISTLLPGQPKVVGPFELVASVDGTGKKILEGPVENGVAERSEKGVYIFVVNYTGTTRIGSGTGEEKGKGKKKIVTPSTTNEGSPKVHHSEDEKSSSRLALAPRGPRKCGHCGDYECKGRGGRQYCKDFQEGIPSSNNGKRKHRKSIPPPHVQEALDMKRRLRGLPTGGRREEDSVQALIQQIQNNAAGETPREYVDPGAPYGGFEEEEERREMRMCALCGELECPGKSERSRCVKFGKEG